MTVAIFPGTFDPFTIGHLDIAQRAKKIFEEVHIVIAHNPVKQTTFNVEERMAIIQETLKKACTAEELSHYTITHWNGLIADYCTTVPQNTVLIKGVRTLHDMDSELTMAAANRRIGNVETLLLPCDPALSHISSSLVKDIAIHHGNIHGLVSELAVKTLEQCQR